MTPIAFGLCAAVLSLLIYMVFATKRTYRKWKERQVPYEEPVLFLGNSLRTVLGKVSQGERMKEVCDSFPQEPLVGFYDFFNPILLVKDADYAEKVLIKDFQHFVDLGFEVNEKTNPLDVSLFSMTGKRWRAVRNKLSPIFTTGKLRVMFEQMKDIGDNMGNVVNQEKMEDMELKDIFGRFAMDVIGSFAFGIEAGTLANPHSKFREMGLKAFEITPTLFIKFIIFSNFPNLSKILGVSFNRQDVQNYFVNIIRETISYRRTNNARRNDFIDLMLQLKDKGSVEITTKDPNDDYLGIDNNYITDSFELTDDIILGNAFVFLTAGFEASAVMMTMACYEWSKNPDIQEKARDEILSKIKEHGRLCFDAVKDMNYLDMCLKETMRKYPPVQMLFRSCTKDYTFPNGTAVKQRETVIVSVYSIHYNPEYYPDPHKFDPERFGPDVYRRPCMFIPFGEGPRICIAMRFSTLQIKYGLAKILTHYKLKPSPKTKEPLKFKAHSFITTPNDPVYFNLEKLN